MYEELGKRNDIITHCGEKLTKKIKSHCCGMRASTITQLLQHGVILNDVMLYHYFGVTKKQMDGCLDALMLGPTVKNKTITYYYRGDIWDYYTDILDYFKAEGIPTIQENYDKTIVDLKDILFKYKIIELMSRRVIHCLGTKLPIPNHDFWIREAVDEAIMSCSMRLTVGPHRYIFKAMKNDDDFVRDLSCTNSRTCSAFAERLPDNHMDCSACDIYMRRTGEIRLCHPSECFIKAPNRSRIEHFMKQNSNLPNII